MRGTMMDFPLTLPTLLERADNLFARVEIVSRRPDRSIVRTCYGDFYRPAPRLRAHKTRHAAGRPRSFDDVEPLRAPGSLLRRAVRRGHSAYLEFAAASARDCRHRQACRGSLPSD